MPYNHETGKWIKSHGETSNAAERRNKNDFFKKYLKGKSIIDIGSGDDPITDDALKYDSALNPEYDGNFCSDIKDESFDVVYSSHMLEDSMCAYLTLRNWWRILKPIGHLILCVPHRDLYEKKKKLPSNWNISHKFFVLPDKEELPYTINLEHFLKAALSDKKFDIISFEVCDSGIKRVPDSSPDVHPHPEYQIEVIIKKVKS